MADNSVAEKIADRLGGLIAASLMSDDLKKELVEGMEEFSMADALQLLHALERERLQVEALTFRASQFLKEQDELWAGIEAKERQAALDIAKEWVQKFAADAGKAAA